jgi:hypothetical protein
MDKTNRAVRRLVNVVVALPELTDADLGVLRQIMRPSEVGVAEVARRLARCEHRSADGEDR